MADALIDPIKERMDRSKETTAAGMPWLEYARVRRAVWDRWPSAMQLRVVTDPFAVALSRCGAVRSVLDVGATSRVWESTVRRHWSGVEYRSLDIDRTNKHDYYDFAEIDREFDLVMCLEVFEHVPADAVLPLARSCGAVCRTGGWMLASVPNVLAPGAQLEFTHQTAFAHADLGAVMTLGGVELAEAARLYTGPPRRLWVHLAMNPLHRFLKVDYCHSVVMLGRKGKV